MPQHLMLNGQRLDSCETISDELQEYCWPMVVFNRETKYPHGLVAPVVGADEQAKRETEGKGQIPSSKINSKTISVRNENYKKIVTGVIYSKNNRSSKKIQWIQVLYNSLHMCVSFSSHMSLSSHVCLSLFSHVSLSSHVCLSLLFQNSLRLFSCSLSVRKSLTCPESQSAQALAHSSVGELLAARRKNLYRCSVVCGCGCGFGGCGCCCVLCVRCGLWRPFKEIHSYYCRLSACF